MSNCQITYCIKLDMELDEVERMKREADCVPKPSKYESNRAMSVCRALRKQHRSIQFNRARRGGGR